MEAAAKSSVKRTGAAGDRELAIRLGALMLHAVGSDGGAVMRAIDDTGLSMVQFKVLVGLARGSGEDDASVKLVAEQLGVSLPSASRAVDDLVKRGLASRKEDPQDRRVRRVALTAAGRALSDRVIDARVAGLESFVATLTPAERRKLDSALELLLEREEIGDLYRTHGSRLR